MVLSASALARAAVFAMQLLQIPIWPSWLPGPNMWADSTIYANDLGLVVQGFIPYRDFSYNYGPLYLYAMLPFYWISPKLAFLPTALADTLTAPLIYLIVKTVAGRRSAAAAGMVYALSPFTVVNEGYLWLSSQPMTLFIVAAVYLMRRNRPLESTLSLAIATLFKQEALFILAALLIWYWKQSGRGMVRGALAGLSTVGMGLGPFLAITPKSMLYSLMYGPFVNFGPVEPSRLPASLANAASTASGNPAICGITTLQGLYTGSLCGIVFNTQQFANFLAMARIYQFALVLEPWLLIVLAFGLIAIRRSPVLFQISSAYSFLALLFVFSTLVHGLYAYYFLPVYSLLLIAGTNKQTTAVAAAALLAVSLVPEGAFQALLPLVAVFGVVILESERLQKRKDGEAEHDLRAPSGATLVVRP